ncbi:MAG TPA: hypothetical protein VF740_01145, partial [Candidatus Acidoferrum sp.]
LLGGLPGVLLGCLLSRYIPAQRLRAVIAVVAICAGLQLVVAGVKARSQKATASTLRSARPSSRYSLPSVLRGSGTN